MSAREFKSAISFYVYMITKTIYENLPFLQAIHPATKAMARDLAAAERVLDIDGLLRRAVDDTETLSIDHPAPWDDIPLPALENLP